MNKNEYQMLHVDNQHVSSTVTGLTKAWLAGDVWDEFDLEAWSVTSNHF